MITARAAHAPLCYDGLTIALHWATAGLVVLLWVIGLTADWLREGAVQTAYWSTHVVGGFLLAGVLAWRLIWRRTGGRRLPPADAGLLHIAAKYTHYGLYVLLFTVVTLGIINAFVRGYGLYGLVHLPQLGDRVWRHAVTDWHGLAANILLALVGVHAGAALLHKYDWHDAVPRRMGPGRADPCPR